MSKGFFRNTIVLAMALMLAPAWAAFAQDSSAPERPTERQATAAEPQAGERRTIGTVTSVGRGSIVVRTDQGAYNVFSVAPGTTRSKPATVGARVSVITLSSDTDAAPTALAINILPRPQGLTSPVASEEDVVPDQVRRLETQIERQARRFRAGLQAGAAFDPTLVSLDAFATLGPFFSRNLQFRPNVEFAFGEVTTLFGIDLDAVYTLPGVPRSIKWAPYIGAGPSFSFSHQGFETQTDTNVGTAAGTVEIDNGRFDFSNFDWNNGFNFIVGFKNPSGTFFEMKSTAWGGANIRLLAGFEF